MRPAFDSPSGVRDRNEVVVMRLLAVLAIVWAGGWLLLIGVPTGEVPVVDRGYQFMIQPFHLPVHADLIVRRLIEFVCLLPAAAFLVAAQAIQKRRHERSVAPR